MNYKAIIFSETLNDLIYIHKYSKASLICALEEWERTFTLQGFNLSKTKTVLSIYFDYHIKWLKFDILNKYYDCYFKIYAKFKLCK